MIPFCNHESPKKSSLHPQSNRQHPALFGIQKKGVGSNCSAPSSGPSKPELSPQAPKPELSPQAPFFMCNRGISATTGRRISWAIYINRLTYIELWF